MRPLLLDTVRLDAPVTVTWAGCSVPMPGTVRRVESRSVGIAIDDPSAARLATGAYVSVAIDDGAVVHQFGARVLHVETAWRAVGGRVQRRPSLLVVTATPDLVQATQHRRFVRVSCALDVELVLPDRVLPGRCEHLAPRGLAAEVEGALGDITDAVVRVGLPDAWAEVHGLVTRAEPLGDGPRHRVCLAFTQDRPVPASLTAFVLQHGFTPIPAILAC